METFVNPDAPASEAVVSVLQEVSTAMAVVSISPMTGKTVVPATESVQPIKHAPTEPVLALRDKLHAMDCVSALAAILEIVGPVTMPACPANFVATARVHVSQAKPTVTDVVSPYQHHQPIVARAETYVQPARLVSTEHAPAPWGKPRATVCVQARPQTPIIVGLVAPVVALENLVWLARVCVRVVKHHAMEPVLTPQLMEPIVALAEPVAAQVNVALVVPVKWLVQLVFSLAEICV